MLYDHEMTEEEKERASNSHDIAVDHHIAQPPVAFQRVQLLEVQNGLLLLIP